MATTLTELAKRLKQTKRGGYKIPMRFVMTDQTRLPDPTDLLRNLGARSCLPMSCLIIRHPDTKQREKLARKLRPLCRHLKIKMLIAGDARLAWRVRADGVHLPDHLTKKGKGAVWPRRKGWLITAAAHSRASIFRAKRAGAGAVLVSPVFSTQSHPEKKPLGHLQFARISKISPLPVIALGGITGNNGQRLLPLRPAGFAGIGGWSR